MNPVMKQLARMAKPFLPQLIDSLTTYLQELKAEQSLEEGETDISGVIHELDGRIYIVMCAFRDQTVTRKIKIISLDQLLEKL